MELLLILTYAAICVAIFKIFRIPANKWTLSTAVLGGIFLIGFIVLVMNYNHPFTDNARIYFTTTPIIPDVKGRVIEVPVKNNALLKKGDILFRIDPSFYEFEVTQRRAAVAEAEQNVTQLKFAVDNAQAAAKAAAAEHDRAKKAFDRVHLGNENARKRGNPEPFSVAEVENKRGIYLSAEGSMQAANARSEQAAVIYKSQIDGVHTSVARLRAALRDAEHELELTTVRAPGPGFVTQVALRPGMYVVPAPFRPVMVFVHHDDRVLAAGFQQNALQRVRQATRRRLHSTRCPGRYSRPRCCACSTPSRRGSSRRRGLSRTWESGPRADGRSQSSTSMATRPPTKFPAARRLRWPSTRPIGTTSPSSAASSCVCAVGRTTSSSKATGRPATRVAATDAVISAFRLSSDAVFQRQPSPREQETLCCWRQEQRRPTSGFCPMA